MVIFTNNFFSIIIKILAFKDQIELLNYWNQHIKETDIEPVIYNGGYWKLRQITVGYEFTKYIPEKWPVKGVRLNFVANNVLIIKKWVDNIDPETFGYSSDNLVGMESTGLPSTRSIGFNLNIKF